MCIFILKTKIIMHGHNLLSHIHSDTTCISRNIEDDDTPKVPRGRRSDLTEKDLEEFTHSFSSLAAAGYLD
jgi:hypothetical protein